MQVFRTMSSGELISYINNNLVSNFSTIRGENTFDYQEETTYIHFFKYLEHALYYMKERSNPIVAKIEIPNDIISNLEYGLYGGVETYYDDSLAGYYIPLPEYVIEKSLFNKDFIIDFSYDGVWQDPFRKKDYANFKNIFWTEQTTKRGFKKIIQKQRWDKEEIYYEYIKSLLPKFNYDTSKIANYLKKVNLEDELYKMKMHIEENQIVTKRMLPRRQ